MKIINGDKLIHTDQTSDVIQHFGTKGMKWGVRKNVGTVGKILGNKIIHPVLTGRAQNNAKLDYMDGLRAYSWNKREIKRNHSDYKRNIDTMGVSKQKARALKKQNAEKEHRALKSLKKEFRKNYSTTAHLNRQYKYIQEAKAAKKQYKADKKAARKKYSESIYGN